MLLADEERRAVVADISAAALSKARGRIDRMGLAQRVVFAVADGLDALDALGDQKPDTVLILGMGGDTVSSILSKGCGKLHGAALILGAQTELPLVRQTLCGIGYRIRREVIAREKERDYIVMRAEPAVETEAPYTEEELLLGPLLLRDLPDGWTPILLRRQRLLKQGIDAMQSAQLVKDHERLALFVRELDYVENALESMKKG